MFSVAISKVLAIGRTLIIGTSPATPELDAAPVRRDVELDALEMASSTRQRPRTRTTSLKGQATCHPQTCIVTVVSTTQAALSATASIQHPHRASVPIFVATHSTTVEDVLASNSRTATSPATSEIAIPRPRDASKRAEDSEERDLIEAELGPVYCTNDAPSEILQKWDVGNPEMNMPRAIPLVDSSHTQTEASEPLAAASPPLVLASAEESWDEFADYYSSTHWLPPAFSPPRPRELYASKFESPVTVFTPARFASSARLLTSTHAPHQALFAQKHAYKAVAHVACLAGASLRTYYDHPDILEKLDMAYVFELTYTADSLLDSLRGCNPMVTIYRSEFPCFGVPHIVITPPRSEEPWVPFLPEQVLSFLVVPRWTYQQEQEEAQEEQEDQEYQAYIDDEGYAAESEQAWSESEAEAEEACTPSPPSWPLALPSMVEGVPFEDDEDTSNIPSVTEACFRRVWLLDEDDEDDVRVYPAPQPHTRPLYITRLRSSFRKTLPDISETSLEDADQTLSMDCSLSWTCARRLSAASPVAATSDSESLYTDACERLDGSETDQSPHVEASETYPERPSEDDDGYFSRAIAVPRPSCDIFLDAESDSDVSPATVTPSRKLPSIPTRKFDWSDSLDSDDLGSPGFDDDAP